MVAISGGSFRGVKPPSFQTSHYYFCNELFWASAAITATANRLYTAWFYVDDPTTFLGGWFVNSNTAANGKNVRTGVWDANGNLKKDFGAVTLDGTSALRSVANSVTLLPGWYRVGLVSDSNPALYSMSPYDSAATGATMETPIVTRFGLFSGVMSPAATAALSWPFAEYAAFTYGALADPMTAMTNTINRNVSDVPAMGLYL